MSWFFKEDYSEPPLVTPVESIRRKADALKLKVEDLRVPRYVLLSLAVPMTDLLVKQVNAKLKPWIYRKRPLYIGAISGASVGVIWAAPGAPLATFVMEDLIACGAEFFVGVGLTGAIQHDIRIGDFLIPTEAIRDEGTSYHYISKDVKAVPSRNVLNALKNACRIVGAKYRVGTIWTTDAPYRETRSKIKHFQSKGVLGVDMETSAVFSLATYRKVKVGCILVTSDNLVTSTSTRGLETAELKEALQEAAKIASKTIEILLKE